MSKKTKTKETMFEKGAEFVNLNQAKQVAEKEGKKIKFKLICGAISLVTSIAWLIYGSGVEGTIAEDILGWLVVIGIAAMLICTNISYLKYFGKCCKITWFLIPIFPVDLIFCVMGGVAFMMASLYVPVLPCLITLYQSYITKKEADSYIAAYNGYSEPMLVEEF
ncbi:MAG: hypothetical protein IJD78_08325 [Clostridia bacterium]|nr:hypothetical protein [Clostridia bacterium]